MTLTDSTGHYLLGPVPRGPATVTVLFQHRKTRIAVTVDEASVDLDLSVD